MGGHRFPLILATALVTFFSACSDSDHRAATVASKSSPVTIGAEQVVDPPIRAPTVRTEGVSNAAFDGANYLVAWTEDRAVYAARVTPSGTLLDPVGFPIADDAVARQRPGVAFGGGTYLVMWSDDSQHVMAKRVSPAGDVLDAVAIDVGQGSDPDPAYDGTNFVAVWRVSSHPWWTRIKAARIDVSGAVLDNPATMVVDGSGTRRYLRAAGGSGQTLACWEDEVDSSLDIFCARIASDGTVAEPEGFELTNNMNSTSNRSPSVAFDGTNWLVVWQRGSNNNAGVFGVRVDATGAKVDTSFGPPHIGTASAEARPHVTYDGSNYVVAYQDDSGGTEDIVATRLQPDMTVLGTTDVSTTPAAQTSPSVASGGGVTWIAWTDDRNDTGGLNKADVYGARVDTSGVLLDGPATDGGVPVSFVANEQGQLKASWSGSMWLVVWVDKRDPQNGSDIWAARFDSAGVLLDPTGIEVATGPGSQSTPDVAWNGVDWLISYTDYAGFPDPSQIRVQRIAGDGSAPDGPDGVVVSPTTTDQWNSSVSWAGSAWMVAYEDRRGGGSYELRATRLNPSLGALGDVVVRTADVGSVDRITINADATRHLVTWTEPSDDRLLGARVEADGTVIDTVPLEIGTGVRRVFPGMPQGVPDSASAGSGWMVVWEDLGDVYMALVLTDGTITPEIVLTGTGDQTLPAVGHDGQQYFVVWRDHGSAASGVDLHGVYVDDAGSILNTVPLVVSSGAGEERTPDVSGSSGDACLLAYDRFDPDPPYRNYRARVRLIASGAAIGASCIDDADCVTQHCSGGVCAPLPPPVDGGAGAGGAGGAAGSAGAAGAAGSSGSSGSAGSGGASGAAGAQADSGVDGAPGGGTGGGSGSGGTTDAAVPPPSGDDGGCGCRTAGRSRTDAPLVTMLVALAFVRRRGRLLRRARPHAHGDRNP